MTQRSNFVTKFSEGFPIYQFLALLTGTLNTMASGMHYGWVSPSLPKLLAIDSPIPMTNDESSWIAVALLFGSCLGSISVAVLLDRIGRKYTILLTSVPFLAAWLIIAFAQSIPELVVARILSGVGDGLIFCSLSIYVAEISNPNIRGFAGASLSLTLAMGMLFMNIIGSNLDIRTAALVASAVPILHLLTFSWMPESPYYLIMKGKHEQAKQSLKKLKGKEDVDQEFERLVEAIEKQNSNSKGCTDLCKLKANRKALFIGVGVRSAQALSGTIGVTFYAQTIFKEAGGNLSPSDSSSIYFATYTMVLGLACVLVDKVGRKPLLIISVTGAGLGVTIVGSYFYVKDVAGLDTTSFTWVPIFALIIFVVSYTLGLQPISCLLMGEIFPTSVKASAAMLCTTSYALFSIAASKFFQVAKDGLGMHVSFFGFTVCCIVSFIFIVVFVPETKGKTLEKIQAEFNGKRQKDSEKNNFE